MAGTTRASARSLARGEQQPLLGDERDAALGSVQPLRAKFRSDLGAQHCATALDALFVPTLFDRDLGLTASSRDRTCDHVEVFAGDGWARRHGERNRTTVAPSLRSLAFRYE